MTIAYISDVHLDHWMSSDTQPKLKQFIKRSLLPTPADILLVAGDIGHYNHQNIQLLKALKSFYPQIAVVHGNHDLYLVSDSQRHKYEWDSFNRIAEFKQLCIDSDIHYLDGDIIDVNGIRIGGLPMWYHVPNIQQWRDFMNDGHQIFQGYPIPYPYSRVRECTFDTNAFYTEQVDKLSAMRDIDILLSHVIPAKFPDLDDRYEDSVYDMYYSSDTEHLLKATGASHCVFGHTHVATTFESNGITYHASAFGYPGEKLDASIQTFEV